MKRFLVGLFLLPIVSACAGAGLSTPATRNQTVPSQGESFQTSKPQSTFTGANDKLYVSNGNSITVYNHAASGNTAPLYTIAGSRTHLNGAGQLSEDAQGNLYVMSLYTDTEPASILVFAPGASGNVAPIRRISGSNTNVFYPEAAIVDKATGKLYVYDEFGGLGTEGESRLIRFPPNANGNVAPFATSPYQLEPAFQIANDSTGLRLIVAHYRTKYEPESGVGVISQTKQFPDGSVPMSAFPISAFDSRGVASDTNTKTYLVSTGEGIYRLAETTTGTYPSLSPTPISVINDVCSSQLVTAPGPNANTYAVHPGYYTGPGCSTAAVYVYANNANGNALPLRILSGPATQLNQPAGIFEGP